MGEVDRLRIDVLGPLTVRRGTSPIDVGPQMVRRLLALLALSPGQPVSRDEIIRALWEGEPPATCVNLVQVYVSRLRAGLGAATPTCPAELVVRDRTGYRLEVGDDVVDVSRFDALHRAARRAQESGDAEQAVSAYEQALGCWRGPVVADLGSTLREHPAAAAAARRRVDAVAGYADLCLTSGRHLPAAEQLHRVLVDEPLDESLYATLMRAHAEGGNRAAALAAYETVRRRLADELGVDPSAELQAAHLRLLRQDTRPTAHGAFGDRPRATPQRPVPPVESDEAQGPPVDAPVPSTAGGRARPMRTGRRFSKGVFSTAAASLVVAIGAIWAVGAGTPQPVPKGKPSVCSSKATAGGGTFAPAKAWDWVTGPILGKTASPEQWASACVTGLTDKDHAAAFTFRVGHGGHGIRIVLNGTTWAFEGDSDGDNGPFTVKGDGILRVSVSAADVATVTYNDVLVVTRNISSFGTFDGRGIAPEVWQNDAPGRVVMTDIKSNVET